jgi:peptidoglycan hydrolase-like protein with peptidoglycan-binding domain
MIIMETIKSQQPKFQVSIFKTIKSASLTLASLAVLMAGFGSVQSASAAQINRVKTNGSCLQVRTTPYINNRNIVDCIPNGAKLAPVVGYQGRFAKLSTGRYVARQWVSTTNTTRRLGTGGQFILSYGSRNAAVRTVQRILGIRPTGYYGTTTTAAVRRFQAARGINVDGQVGPQTRRAMGI